MHTLEVTILKPEAEAMLDDMEKNDLIKVEHEADAHSKPKKNRTFGSMPGLVLYMSEDFNEPLEDFADYM